MCFLDFLRLQLLTDLTDSLPPYPLHCLQDFKTSTLRPQLQDLKNHDTTAKKDGGEGPQEGSLPGASLRPPGLVSSPEAPACRS